MQGLAIKPKTCHPACSFLSSHYRDRLLHCGYCGENEDPLDHNGGDSSSLA